MRVARSARCSEYPATLGASVWVNWYGRSPLVSSICPKRASSKCSVTVSSVVNVAIIPSTDSNASGSFVETAAGSATGVPVGSGVPLESTRADPPPVVETWVISKNSATVPSRRTRSPVAMVGQLPRQNTNMPSDVAGSVSASPSSSCTKKPSRTSWRVNNDVTTASTMTASPTSSLAGPAPWIVEISVTGATVTVMVHDAVSPSSDVNVTTTG